MIITVDGPAAAGKGTISSYLSAKYKLAYFDTGMVYRAVGLQMVLTGVDLQNQDAAHQIAGDLTFPQMMELSLHPDFGCFILSRGTCRPFENAAGFCPQSGFCRR